VGVSEQCPQMRNEKHPNTPSQKMQENNININFNEHSRKGFFSEQYRIIKIKK